ncbi:hypothetical protein CCP1ISM_60011 [Azospirillaceae bacterium]
MTKEKDNPYFIIGVTILVSVLMFFTGFYAGSKKEVFSEEEFVKIWSCYDGCFFSICSDAISVVPINESNETCSNANFQKCANKCFDKFEK